MILLRDNNNPLFKKNQKKKLVEKPIEKLELKKEEEEIPKQTQIEHPVQSINYSESSVYSSINGGADNQGSDSSGIVPYNI